MADTQDENWLTRTAVATVVMASTAHAADAAKASGTAGAAGNKQTIEPMLQEQTTERTTGTIDRCTSEPECSEPTHIMNLRFLNY